MQNRCLSLSTTRPAKQEIKLQPLVLPPPGGFVLEGAPCTDGDESLNPSIASAVIKVICGIILFGAIAVAALAFLLPMFMPAC